MAISSGVTFTFPVRNKQNYCYLNYKKKKEKKET